MPKQSTSGITVAGWWLTDGDEECPHCGRLYLYELEVRCADCDGPGCPHCTSVQAEGRLICVACTPLPSGEGASQ